MNRSILALSALLSLALAGCTSVDNRCSGDGEALADAQADFCVPGQRISDDGFCVPNGYCEVTSECEESDFCLVEWCYGPSSQPCKDVHRCTPRGGEGSICEGNSWCAEGLRCDLPKDCGGYPCKASVCVPGPPS